MLNRIVYELSVPSLEKGESRRGPSGSSERKGSGSLADPAALLAE